MFIDNLIFLVILIYYVEQFFKIYILYYIDKKINANDQYINIRTWCHFIIFSSITIFLFAMLCYYNGDAINL